MRRRADKQLLDHDPANPIAVETQKKLLAVNEVMAECCITYCPAHHLYAAGARQLYPTHFRLFHENWQHGRIYLEADGVGISLRKSERQTIKFDGEPGVELDFGGMHPRMAYHRRGLEAPSDPYRLWSLTGDALRQLAKLVINTAINAESRRDAIGACCELVRLKTKSGKWKEGNRRRRAYQLRHALSEVGVCPKTPAFFIEARRFFDETYDLAAQYHAPIVHDFLTGLGRELMRIESNIALDVLYCLATKGVPILGIHDSFIVPQSYCNQLHEVMVQSYRTTLGFAPIVK
jgi:hypothetical protein